MMNFILSFLFSLNIFAADLPTVQSPTNTAQTVGLGVNGGFLAQKRTDISTQNSTTATLGAGGTYAGTFEDISGYATVSILIKSSHASATNGLILELSADGTTAHSSDTYTLSANTGKVYSVPAYGKYFRVRYVNGATAQTSFVIQTKYFVDYPKPSSHRIDENIISQDDAELVKAVITGQRPDGIFTNIDTTTAGNLKTSVQEFDPSTFGPKTVAQSPTVNIATDQSQIPVFLQRPSEGTGRSHVSANIDNVTATTTIYTVTAGKTFYLTDLMITATNSSTTANGRFRIRDNVTTKIPKNFGASIVGAVSPFLNEVDNFIEPIPFTTNVNLEVVAGTLSVSVAIVGYEK